MLYGHVETFEDRIDAPRRCCATCRTRPAASSPTSRSRITPTTTSSASSSDGRARRRPASTTCKNLAVGRLFLDNFDHIKSHWIMVTPSLSQTSLAFGVNDLEGTVVREKIYHEAGAHTAQAMSLDEILRLIRGAGKTPAERDSFYNILRTFDRRRRTRGGGRDDARRTHSRTSTAIRSTARSTAASCRSTRSSSTASRPTLNRRMARGELDISVVSAVEYARDAERVSAAARPRDLLRWSGAQRHALLEAAGRASSTVAACSSAEAR